MPNLVVVNTVRLDDAELEELDKLGRVTDVIRLAGNHGSDDPFYAEVCFSAMERVSV